MTISLIDEMQRSSDAMNQFLADATATSMPVKSPAGKTIARKFNFSHAGAVSATVYPLADRHRIVKMLRLGLTDFYVHLERKKAIYGFDPVRALDLLEPSIDELSDSEFHQSIVDLIARTRDRHLVFRGRAPIGISAVLPFAVEQSWQGANVQYVVTKIESGFNPQKLRVGALVTHWNGIPSQRFLLLNANVFDGGNQAASLARSIAFLTHRPLNEFAAPLEEWVDLRFTLQEIEYEERFTWQGFDASQVPVMPSIGRNRTGYGGDLELLYLQRARRVQFAPESFDQPQRPAPSPTGNGVPNIIGRDRSGDFDYGSVITDYGTFGYVRLWNFSADTADDIANAFVRVLPLLPKTGLIIDLRGNSGGYIAAGERILQLFTPNQITPSRFQFRVTPAVQSMVKQWDEFKTWTPSVGQANLTGEPYSQGYSIEGTDVDANQLGQHYFGPVVLIGDALAFSTADIFTAGFIDHEIGKVICTDENMAAAGGNNWYPWDVIRLYNPDFHLDPALKPTFEAGLLSQEVRDAFNYCGATLSEHAVLSAGQPEYDGIAWSITDGAITHVVRSLPLDTKLLCVYLAKGNFGLADMPSGITVSLTMRRCIRVKKSEGQILEDLGIHPDIVYHLTFRDVMEQNQDLNIRASLELSKMPVYDLQVNVAPKGDMYALMCRTLHLNSIEVFAGQHFLTGAPASDDTSVELSIPAMVGKIEVCGLVADAIVARSVIIAPPLGLTIHQITESNAR